MQPDLTDIHARQNASIDSVVAAFEQHLKAIVDRAEIAVIAELQKKLATEDGVILRTPANSRLLRKIDDLFLKAMDEGGYGRLVSAYVNSFAGQLPYFQETLTAISREAGQKFSVKFTNADKASFAALQTNAVSAIESVVSGVAGRAMQNALMSVGGVKFKDLMGMLRKKLSISVGQATGLADTSLTSYYRTVNDRGYKIIEDENPQLEFRYRYFGPLDKKNRPFCREMETKSKAGVTWTREEIDKMNNGQTPVGTVMQLCGGFRCRHVMLLQPGAQVAKAA